MKRLIIILGLVCCTMGIWAQKATYSISASKTARDVVSGGEKGMCCVADFTVRNYTGGVRMCAELQYKTGNGKWAAVKLAHSSNLAYAVYDCGSGTVWAQGKQVNVSRGYNSFSGYRMFLPYNAITHPAGRVEYRWRIFVFEDDDIMSGDYLYAAQGGYYDYSYFSLNWPQSNR